MLAGITVSDYLKSVLDLMIPRVCLVCGEKLSLEEDHICGGCLADLPRTYYSIMPRNRMADRLNALIQKDLDGLSNPVYVPYANAAALFFYRASTGYRNITKSLKYRGNIPAGRYFARMLAEEMRSSSLYGDVDLVVPVPLHWTRRWARGYNQSEIIGRVLADAFGADFGGDVLVRMRKTRTQTHLSLLEKTVNVAGAFAVRDMGRLNGFRHILLVDDVFTTGSTVHACYSELRKIISPEVKVSVATLACVGD